MTERQTKDLINFHKKGLSNRKIARELNIHHRTVGKYLTMQGLKPNGTTSVSPKFINGKHIKCSKCSKVKHETEYLICRPGQKYEYRLSYCNSCRSNQLTTNMNKDKFNVLRDIYLRTKQRCKKKKIKFNLLWEDLKNIYTSQKGKCFYSSKKLDLIRGKGTNWNSCTLDKVVPSKGYNKTNVVLCTRKFNTVKNDLSLREIKKYMPMWYKKLKECPWLRV